MSLDEHSEDIATVDLKIAEITSLALELKGCLVYGRAVSKKLPTSFVICCSKAFYDGALLDNT